MSELKVSLFVDGKRNSLHISDSSEELVKSVAVNFFANCGVVEIDYPGIKYPNSSFSNDKSFLGDALKKVSEELTGEKQEDDTAENKQSHSKKLPKLNSERTLSQSLADKFDGIKTEDLSDEPDHYKTGIKVKDGVKHYKTRYFCKNSQCGHQGNHYLPEGTEDTYCRECNGRLKVREASGEGFPNRDAWGNFYIADIQLEEGSGE